MPTKKYMDEHVLLHTLRIELLNGNVLFYHVDAHRKGEIEHWLHQKTDNLMERADEFISIYALPDRMAFIRIATIKRIIFCWDAVFSVTGPEKYYDHFKVTEEVDGELLIPNIIIMLRQQEQPLLFSDIPFDDFPLGLTEESFYNPHFLKGGFICLPDEDGESNFIPIVNIDCMELDRVFIYSDEIWQEMENDRMRDENKN